MRTILFSILMLVAAPGFSQTLRNVGPEEFRKLMATGKYEVIDLRTDDEIKSRGMIKGAKQINFLATDAEAQIGKLDKKKSYLLYCAGGGRSSDAAELMKTKGFKEIVNLEKGFDDWKKKGFETVNR